MKLKLLLLFFSTQFLFSQITFTEVKKLGDTTKAKIFKYDGKSEFLKDYYKLFVDLNPEYYGNDEKRHKDLLNYYKQYIGYDLFFLGKPVIFTNKKSQEYIHPKAKSPIITKLYYPICKNCTSARYFDKEKVVNDSIKSYISEYKILEVSFKAKDFGFDNERITYEENSPIFQDEYTINVDGNRSDIPIFKLLNKSTNDIVYTVDLENILFLPHYNFLKEKYNEKKLIYLTNNGVTGDGVNLPFKDLLTNEPFVVKNNAILYSKVELLRKNAVYGDDNDKFGFAPFVVLQTEENKKTAISERDLQRTFSYNKGKIIEYNEYLKELEIAKLSNIEREKKIIYEKVQNERNKLEKLKQLKIKYGDHFGSLILNEQLEIGMSKEMCNESIGNPYETKTVIRENLKYEICYYYGGFKLSFLNDELKQIEL